MWRIKTGKIIDDPRKGGKGYAEKVADGDTTNGDTSLKGELVFKKEASINESCVQMKLANPGVSLLETVREKGYESISKLVKGFFYNKNENSEKILDDGRSTINRNANEIINNQEYKIINEEQNDASEWVSSIYYSLMSNGTNYAQSITNQIAFPWAVEIKVKQLIWPSLQWACKRLKFLTSFSLDIGLRRCWPC